MLESLYDTDAPGRGHLAFALPRVPVSAPESYARDFSSRLSTLPVALRGSCSRNTTSRGTL
jgi:hypothetical protein